MELCDLCRIDLEDQYRWTCAAHTLCYKLVPCNAACCTMIGIWLTELGPQHRQAVHGMLRQKQSVEGPEQNCGRLAAGHLCRLSCTKSRVNDLCWRTTSASGHAEAKNKHPQARAQDTPCNDACCIPCAFFSWSKEVPFQNLSHHRHVLQSNIIPYAVFSADRQLEQRLTIRQTPMKVTAFPDKVGLRPCETQP